MSNKEKPFLIVGIGASAGGLAVLKAFVSALPDQTGMAFIIIQHLDPNHKSLLGELLAKESPLPVLEAEDGQKVEPDHIYVIPPDTYLELEGDVIKLTSPKQTRGSRKAIDHFFRSLAQHCGTHCAGIVLSGSGSDGTAGLREIKAAGGLSLAQPPDEAEHSSMPLSAIDAGVIDKVVPVKKMPALLKQYAQHPLTLREEEDNRSASAADSLGEITAILKTHEDFNLHQYKPATVQRRIARRMSLANTEKYQDYLEKLRKSSEERRHLTKDLLINVTDFFRDPDAFAVLEKKVIPDILHRLEEKEDLRVWIAGCASGEEAYSIAILLQEAMSATQKKNKIKIFATDIDEYAIKIARKGVYPASIAGEIPKKYLGKYFNEIQSNQHYQVKNQIRDLISFAVQNVATDPPFNHMHLICCRNLLIYFKKEIQDKVLSSFYFSLEGASYLFLGSSETIGNKNELFKKVSKKWRIYQKIPGGNEKKVLLQHLHLESSRFYKRNKPARDKNRMPSRSDLLRRSLLQTFLAPGVIVDREGYIIYNHGNWKDYLTIPTGEPRNEISQLVLPALRSRIRSALYKVRKNGRPLTFHCPIPSENNKETKTMVRVEMAPMLIEDLSEEEVIGIIFYPAGELTGNQAEGITKHDEVRASQNIEQELIETREELQNTIEELETSTEELKASHEEALSTNEELQSANEELEASSEELRSLNEELSTVNMQLREKIEELQEAKNDLQNFFSSTNMPTIFLDPDLNIQRYTTAAEHLLKMGPKDIGRPIHSLGRDLVDGDLIQECKEVLTSFQPIRREKQAHDGRWFIRQITPYRTEDRRIDGVVLTFQDVTDIKRLSNRAERREQQQSVVAKLGLMALSGIEPQDLMQQVVRQVAHTLDADYCKVLKYQPESKNLLLVAGVGWQEGLVGKAVVPDDQKSQAGYTLLSHEPVIVKNLSKERRFTGPRLLTEHEVVSGISCVINHYDPPYGVLGVHTKKYREFTIDDANFLVSVANVLSTALRTKEAEKEIRLSEERLKMAREAAKIGIHDYDVKNNIVEWDRTIREIWGVPDDLTPITYEIFEEGLHPEDREAVNRAVEEALEGRKPYHAIYRVINPHDQSMRWVEATGKVIFENNQAVRLVGTAQDITQRVETQQKLVKSEEKLRIAMATNNLGSFEFFFQREETHWDDLLLELWGVGKAETLTQEIFWEGVHPEDTEMVREKLDAAAAPEGDGYYHAVYRVVNRKTKAESWVEATGQTIFENDKPVKMIGMVIDITDRKELETSLQKAVAELQDIDEKKNEFLSILGHELRNPLTSLKAGLDILETRINEPDQVLEVMKRSIETMGELLDDLLDLNRISQNKVRLNLRTVEVGEILKGAVAQTQSIFQRKGQQVKLNIAQPLMVYGDPTRLEQVFSNLIINACKYTPEGGKIRLNADQADRKIRVRVHDTGVGLDKEILDKIFDPFFQVKQEGKSPSGLGVGLALSKRLVELHNGTIKAYSEGRNEGATFTVILPAQDGVTTIPEEDRVKEKPVVKPGLKIIMIEDNEDLLLTMPTLLERNFHCLIKTAKTGQAGLQLAESFTPDVFLVDIGLPDISGYDVAAALRKKGFDGLLVAMSGYSHQEARAKSKAAGFDFHLAKPSEMSEFAAVLQTIS